MYIQVVSSFPIRFLACFTLKIVWGQSLRNFFQKTFIFVITRCLGALSLVCIFSVTQGVWISAPNPWRLAYSYKFFGETFYFLTLSQGCQKSASPWRRWKDNFRVTCHHLFCYLFSFRESLFFPPENKSSL